jgi:hypothetical protein
LFCSFYFACWLCHWFALLIFCFYFVGYSFVLLTYNSSPCKITIHCIH